jgi:hypothetical protein
VVDSAVRQRHGRERERDDSHHRESRDGECSEELLQRILLPQVSILTIDRSDARARFQDTNTHRLEMHMLRMPYTCTREDIPRLDTLWTSVGT